MNTKLLIIIGIVISAIIVISSISLQSFDSQEYSNENPYEFSAKVLYSKDFIPLMCPIPNACQTHLQLQIWSETPAVLQAYKICNGFSCLEQDQVEYITTNYGTIPLFDENQWNVGDKISIKVKVVTHYDETYTHHPFPQPFYIDLGESEIIEYGLNENEN